MLKKPKKPPVNQQIKKPRQRQTNKSIPVKYVWWIVCWTKVIFIFHFQFFALLLFLFTYMLLEKISYLKIETKVNNLNIIFTNIQVSKLTKHGIDFV